MKSLFLILDGTEIEIWKHKTYSIEVQVKNRTIDTVTIIYPDFCEIVFVPVTYLEDNWIKI